jgi:hypothetical protein
MLITTLYIYATQQTDVKRARFRNDATSDDDMLGSCLELDCDYIRARLPKAKKNARSHASTRGRATKRARQLADEDDSDGDNDDCCNSSERRVIRSLSI